MWKYAVFAGIPFLIAALFIVLRRRGRNSQAAAESAPRSIEQYESELRWDTNVKREQEAQRARAEQ